MFRPPDLRCFKRAASQRTLHRFLLFQRKEAFFSPTLSQYWLTALITPMKRIFFPLLVETLTVLWKPRKPHESAFGLSHPLHRPGEPQGSPRPGPTARPHVPNAGPEWASTSSSSGRTRRPSPTRRLPASEQRAPDSPCHERLPAPSARYRKSLPHFRPKARPLQPRNRRAGTARRAEIWVGDRGRLGKRGERGDRGAGEVPEETRQDPGKGDGTGRRPE